MCFTIGDNGSAVGQQMPSELPHGQGHQRPKDAARRSHDPSNLFTCNYPGIHVHVCTCTVQCTASMLTQRIIMYIVAIDELCTACTFVHVQY